jgi:hypothetical protein
LQSCYQYSDVHSRGMQVTIVRNNESPLGCYDSGRGALRGVVKYSSPEIILVRLSEKSDDFKNAASRWRLDVGFCDVGYLRTLEAIKALNFNPEDQEAQSTSSQEVILRGTYLRKEILQSRGLPQISDQIDSPGAPDNSSGVFLDGAFAHDERICDWAKRYSTPNPKRKAGDPEIPLNPTQVQAIAQMLRERVSLVQGVCTLFQLPNNITLTLTYSIASWDRKDSYYHRSRPVAKGSLQSKRTLANLHVYKRRS